jgi:CAP12/Pycsar effector protein, TIR domain
MSNSEKLDLQVFKQVSNAITDLQRSTLQTFERPLKRLAHALHSSDLALVSEPLKERVDLDRFISEGEKTGGSFVGSQSLEWPTNPEDEFGLVIALVDRFAAQPNDMLGFCHTFFYSGSKAIAGVHAFAAQVLVPFVRDYQSYVDRIPGMAVRRAPMNHSRKIFIVHGHDDGSRETVARFLERIGFEPIILHKQANRGMTVVEKLTAYGDVGFAVVLLTPDDVGRSTKDTTLNPRARQNVVLELGYFIGRLTRARVCALKRGDVGLCWGSLYGVR